MHFAALRHPTLPVLLWVDAVCINQQDDAERSSQIMLMPRIYHRCLRVLVWLGETDSDTRPAFDAVRWLAPQYDRYIEGKERRLHPGPETLHDEAFLLRSGLPPFSSGAYGPFMRLLDRPVFRRIWCVQEVAFHWNVVVVCGSQKSRVPEVAYADIAKACSFLRLAGWNGELQTAYVSGRDVLFFPTAVIGTQSNWFGKRVDRSLLVYEMRSFEVTDPRDKIFAMLGLLNDHSHRQLHELGVPSNDKCQNGHAISCPHFRIEIMNWAETKWEQHGGIHALWYTANSRIYRLRDTLVDFFNTVIVLLECIPERTTATQETDGCDIVDKHRSEADTKYMRLRRFLDKMSDEYVDSNELVAYRWASEKIEHCTDIYDEVHTMYKLGMYEPGGFTFPTTRLEDVVLYRKMLRREDEYATSSVTGSPNSDVEQEDDDTESKVTDNDGKNPGQEGEKQSGPPSEEQEDLKDDKEDSKGDRADPASHTPGPRVIFLTQRKSPLPAGTQNGHVGAEFSPSRRGSEKEGLSSEKNDGQDIDQISSEDNLADNEERYYSSDSDPDAWMKVGKDEIPAELSLYLYLSSNGGINTVSSSNLRYMAPRVRYKLLRNIIYNPGSN
jgi:hypothetical protein